MANYLAILERYINCTGLMSEEIMCAVISKLQVSTNNLLVY